MAHGFQVSQDAHVVNLLPPVDITGGTTSQAFNMAGFGHASIFLLIGVSAAAPGLVTVQAGTAAAAVGAAVAGAAAIPFDVYKQETAGASHDVLGARVAIASTGFTPAATDGIFYVIEIDGEDLPSGSSWAQLALANTVNSVIASAIVILSGARYAGDQSLTATA